ncbi:hypothetical protein D3C81_1423280 [compost metagenome]
MTGTVLDIRNQRFRLAQLLQNRLDDMHIRTLVVAADVVHFSQDTFMDDQINRAAMVLDVEPVPNIHPVTVHRKRSIRKCAGDHQRDQLLREVIRTVVIRAAGNIDRQAEGLMVRAHQQVASRFTCGVRAVWRKRSLFRKESGSAQRSIHLIGRYLHEFRDLMLFSRIQQHLSAKHIRLHKHIRLQNTPVHMRLRRKVHDHIHTIANQGIHRLNICNIRFNKTVIRMVLHRFQIFQIPCIRQGIHVNDLIVRMLLKHIDNKVAANKSGSAGYEEFHC